MRVLKACASLTAAADLLRGTVFKVADGANAEADKVVIGALLQEEAHESQSRGGRHEPGHLAVGPAQRDAAGRVGARQVPCFQVAGRSSR